MTPFYEPAFGMGGLALAPALLAREQARRGIQVSVFTTDAGLPVSPESRGWVREQDHEHVHHFPTRFRSHLFYSSLLRRAVRQRIKEFDIVHVHGLWNFPGAWGARAARRAGIPYVVSPHGSLNRAARTHHAAWKWPYWMLIERQTVRHACRLLFASEQEAAEARAWVGHHAAEIIPFPIPPAPPHDPAAVQSWRARVGVPPDARLVGFLGRLHPIKGIGMLLETLRYLPAVHLVIAGGSTAGMELQLRRRAAALGVGPRVHWVGELDETARTLMLAGLDVFAYPSQSENFGLAVAEAMAAGVPVVVTPGVGLASLIDRDGAGLVADRDAASLAGAISRVLMDEGSRRAMSAAARRVVAEQLSPEAVTRRIVGLYEQCIAAAQGRRETARR